MKLNYKIKGIGKDIILLHGWGGNISSLKVLSELLVKKGFRVTNLEWPDFNENDRDNKPLKLINYVEILNKFVESKKFKSPIFVGHSFGGKVLIKASTIYPNIFKELVLINASGIKDKNTFKKVVFNKISKGAKLIGKLPVLNKMEHGIKKVYYKYIVREMDYYKSINLRETFKNIVEENLDEILHKIKSRVLIIWGEKDRITPLYMGQKLALGIKGARFKVIEGYGHGLPLVNPEIVSELIYNFIKS